MKEFLDFVNNFLPPVIQVISNWAIPIVITTIVAVAYVRGVKCYEAFVTGAKEGFDIIVMIIPYLVAILFVIGGVCLFFVRPESAAVHDGNSGNST